MENFCNSRIFFFSCSPKLETIVSCLPFYYLFICLNRVNKRSSFLNLKKKFWHLLIFNCFPGNQFYFVLGKIYFLKNVLNFGSLRIKFLEMKHNGSGDHLIIMLIWLIYSTKIYWLFAVGKHLHSILGGLQRLWILLVTRFLSGLNN